MLGRHKPASKKPDIEAALHFDALAEAEKVTGKSYKEDQGTGILGMLMMMQHSAATRALLKDNKDTWLGMGYDDFWTCVEEGGFEFKKVWENTFDTTPGYANGKTYHEREALYVDFKRGWVMYGESHEGNRLNNATVHFQTRVINPGTKEGLKQNIGDIHDLLSSCHHSGGCETTEPEYIIHSWLDCREGVLFRLQSIDMCPAAARVPQWIPLRCPPSFLTYWEWQQQERETGKTEYGDDGPFGVLRRKKEAMFPVEVRKLMGLEK